MKKTISLILSLIIMCGLFASCGAPQSQSGGKLKIIATVFPEYDWIKNILGEKADDTQLTLLLDNGIDLHSYQPTADDLIEISACDVFVYVGGESDGWVDGALAQAVNKDMIVINLLDVLGDRVREEEIKEGMQAEEEEDREAEEDEDPEYDEHVWLSLKNAAYICKYIAEKLGEADPASKDVFTSNAAAYIEKLNALDKQYKSAVDSAETKTMVFGDRFPFRYLADDYSLDYYAAFVGCSAESEASFETITFLAGKVKELGVKNVVILEGSDGKIADTVIKTSGADGVGVVTLNSMQSVTSTEVENGADYLSIMTGNLENLKIILG